jgi:hypothetical protein
LYVDEIRRKFERELKDVEEKKNERKVRTLNLT